MTDQPGNRVDRQRVADNLKALTDAQTAVRQAAKDAAAAAAAERQPAPAEPTTEAKK